MYMQAYVVSYIPLKLNIWMRAFHKSSHQTNVQK